MIEPDLHPPDDQPDDEDGCDAGYAPDPEEPSEAEYERGAWLAEAEVWGRVRGR